MVVREDISIEYPDRKDIIIKFSIRIGVILKLLSLKYRKIKENIPTIVILVLFLVILSASLWMVILYSKSPSSNSQNIISHLFNKSRMTP
jgi:prolipoprotein diacylglyceryltransferase